MNTDLISYYKQRAQEYENIYLKPERQEDIQAATAILQNDFTNKNILEIACGTGFWTEKIAETAVSIMATDINKALIEIAEQKHYLKNNVKFKIEDIYQFSTHKKYESLFGGFIWSHIKLQDLNLFLETINSLIVPGGTVVLMDNLFVEDSNLPITNTDAEGNTFQTRKLQDGTTHLVLKNFPSEEFLHKKLEKKSTNFNFIRLKYFWILTYQTPSI
jgi:2-polyprenyl-3-methyl-5-hydroxy-6-metoxy-1,4-benzoquinol methylase